MIPVLLDTHVFVWALSDPGRVPASAWPLLRDPEVPLLLSVASAWELAIKASMGKISLPGGVEAFVAEGCRATGVRLLGVELAHAVEVGKLPWHHRDPFDRMLIAQARIEGAALLSFDRALQAYEVQRA